MEFLDKYTPYTSLLEDFNAFLETAKKKEVPTTFKQIRFLNIVLFFLPALICLVYPDLFKLVYGGYYFNNDSTRLFNEFLRIFAVVALAVAYLNHDSRNWSSDIHVANLMTFTFLLSTLTRIWFVFYGGAYFYYVDVLVFGLMTFLNAKAAKKF